MSFETADDVLEHFGIKGMRWGVRNSSDSSAQKNESDDWSKKKKAAVVLGSVALAATIAVGALYAKNHMDVSLKDISSPSSVTTNLAKALAKEPVAMMHSSRGKNRGYAFLRDGGMKTPNEEFLRAGLDKANVGFFRRYGDQGEKVAARFSDPEGRKDFSGRLIGHDVILPKSMSIGINNADDAARIAWPLIKPMFDAFYRSENDAYGPGF